MCCQSLRKAMCESLRFFDHFKAFCFLTEVWVVYASACNMGCCQRSELWSLIFTSGITIHHVLSQSWSDWKVDVAWHFKQWRCTCWFSSVVTRVLLAVPADRDPVAAGRNWTLSDVLLCSDKNWQNAWDKILTAFGPDMHIFRQTTTSTSHKPAPKSVLRVAKSIWACSAPADVSYCNLPRHLMDDLNLLGPHSQILVPSRLRESGQAEYARVD